MSKEHQNYLVSVQLAKSFLYGQLELYKIEFVRTENNNFLEVMNNINHTGKTIKYMDEVITRQSKEILKLKKQIETIKNEF